MPETNPPQPHETPPARVPILRLRSRAVLPGSVTRVPARRMRGVPSKGLAFVPSGSEPAEAGGPAPGTLCRSLGSGDGRERWLVGLRRAVADRFEDTDEGPVGRARPVEDLEDRNGATLEAHVRELAEALARSDERVAEALDAARFSASGPGEMLDRLAAALPLATLDRVRLVEERSLRARAELVTGLVRDELARTGALPAAATHPVGDPKAEELEAFHERLGSSRMPSYVRKRVRRELTHYERSTTGSAEESRLRGWIEWVLELPWEVASPDPGEDELQEVIEALDATHSGLADVKTRVAEFLAIRQLGGAASGTVLCFAGPAGTGKTSMARAVAAALGREFVYVHVGGLTDERELRGRHHTHSGAVPGRLLQGISRAGTSNPVVLIDEIDQAQFTLETDAGGVLLEILDREQNQEFLDHYLGVPFDLSQCVFVVTANDLEDLPEALVDRLEVIYFGSYTEAEKLAIAREHLIPRARANAGLDKYQFKVTPGALRAIVREYTEEAGVRQLQRQLARLARKAAMDVVRGNYGLQVRKAALPELLGPAIADDDLQHRRPLVGLAYGMAWTAAGGAMLPIEALKMTGGGRTTLTGSIGDVMRESVQTAVSWVRTRFGDLGIEPEALESLDLHLHFPSGATPKDGPSAGIAVATSLVSLLTETPVRHDVAMTGEMSLHGAVLPVGGLREKLLAAQRAGIRTVIVPARNSDEVLRLPPDVRRHLRIELVEHVQAALALALIVGRRSRVREALARPLPRTRAPRRARRSAPIDPHGHDA